MTMGPAQLRDVERLLAAVGTRDRTDYAQLRRDLEAFIAARMRPDFDTPRDAIHARAAIVWEHAKQQWAFLHGRAMTPDELADAIDGTTDWVADLSYDEWRSHVEASRRHNTKG